MMGDGTEVQEDFAECSSFSYFIPLDSELDLDSIYQSTANSEAEPFASVDRRDSLFFGKPHRIHCAPVGLCVSRMLISGIR